jgi:hypothetical protein
MSKGPSRPIQVSVVDEHADEVCALQISLGVPQLFVRDVRGDAGVREHIARALCVQETSGPIGNLHGAG